MEPGFAPHYALTVLNKYKALVLDAAYRPVEVVGWQRAICLDLMEKVCCFGGAQWKDREEGRWEFENPLWVVMQLLGRGFSSGCQIIAVDNIHA